MPFVVALDLGTDCGAQVTQSISTEQTGRERTGEETMPSMYKALDPTPNTEKEMKAHTQAGWYTPSTLAFARERVTRSFKAIFDCK